jgi:hypothetical protein
MGLAAAWGADHGPPRRDTTDLKEVMADRRRFTWGDVTAFHKIGPYDFIEYVDSHHRTRFHVYVNGACMAMSAGTLDMAILLAIGQRNLETNDGRQSARAAARVFDLPERWG